MSTAARKRLIRDFKREWQPLAAVLFCRRSACVQANHRCSPAWLQAQVFIPRLSARMLHAVGSSTSGSSNVFPVNIGSRSKLAGRPALLPTQQGCSRTRLKG